MRQIHTIVKCSYPKLATVTGIQNLKPAISEQKKCTITSDISVHVVKYFIQAKELPFRCVGRVWFWYLDGSSDSLPNHKLFQAKIAAITQGPSTIWFSMTWNGNISKKIFCVYKLHRYPTQCNGGCKAHLGRQICKCLLGHPPIKELIPYVGTWTIKWGTTTDIRTQNAMCCANSSSIFKIT
jgi:hypothetical protein